MENNDRNREKPKHERDLRPQQPNPRIPQREQRPGTEARSKRRVGDVVPGFGGGTPSTTPGGASGKM